MLVTKLYTFELTKDLHLKSIIEILFLDPQKSFYEIEFIFV